MTKRRSLYSFILVFTLLPLLGSHFAFADENKITKEKEKTIAVEISVKGVLTEYGGRKAAYLRIDTANTQGDFVSPYQGETVFVKLPATTVKLPTELTVGARYQFSVFACDEEREPLTPSPSIVHCKVIEEDSALVELEQPTGILTLSGSVRDTNGKPVAETNVWVACHCFVLPFTSSFVEAHVREAVLGRGGHPTWATYYGKTDKEGNFNITRLPEGTYHIISIEKGKKSYKVKHMNKAGATIVLTADRELSICVEDPLAVLRGRIVNAAGEPISLAKDEWVRLGKVYARRNSSYCHEESSQIDSEGRFEIKSLLRDKYFIDVALETLPIPKESLIPSPSPIGAYVIRTFPLIDLTTDVPDEISVILPPIEKKSHCGIGFVLTDEKTGKRLENVVVSLVEGPGNCRLFDNPIMTTKRNEDGSVTWERFDRAILPTRRANALHTVGNETIPYVKFDGMPPGKYVFFVQAVKHTKDAIVSAGFRRIEVDIQPRTMPILSYTICERRGEGKIRGKCTVPEAFGQSRIPQYYEVLAYDVESGHGGTAVFEQDGAFLIEGLAKGKYAVCLYSMNYDSRVGPYNLLSKKLVSLESDAADVRVDFNIPVDGE